MDKINNEVLFCGVKARPAIWQAKHEDHRNKFTKAVFWVEVAAAVLRGATDIGVDAASESIRKRTPASVCDSFL